MKEAVYKGVTYSVPEWTKWLAEDNTGELWAYQKKPTNQGMFWLSIAIGEYIATIDHTGTLEPTEPVEID